jgi:hypothetical protein
LGLKLWFVGPKFFNSFGDTVYRHTPLSAHFINLKVCLKNEMPSLLLVLFLHFQYSRFRPSSVDRFRNSSKRILWHLVGRIGWGPAHREASSCDGCVGCYSDSVLLSYYISLWLRKPCRNPLDFTYEKSENTSNIASILVPKIWGRKNQTKPTGKKEKTRIEMLRSEIKWLCCGECLFGRCSLRSVCNNVRLEVALQFWLQWVREDCHPEACARGAANDSLRF